MNFILGATFCDHSVPTASRLRHTPTMIVDANNPNGACTVSRYRRVIQNPWLHAKQNQIATFPVRNDPKAISQIPMEQDAMPIAFGEHPSLAVVRSGDNVRDVAPRESNQVVPYENQEPYERRLLYLSDDSCGEEACSTGSRKRGQCYKKRQSRSSQQTKDQCQRVNARDCSDGEECYQGDSSDSCSDSEIEVYGAHLQSHKRKMKKWTSLARSKFEHMLLECIVNTGK